MSLCIGSPAVKTQGMYLLDISDDAHFVTFLKHAHKKLSERSPNAMDNVIWFNTEIRKAGVFDSSFIWDCVEAGSSDPKIFDYLTTEQARDLGDYHNPVYVIGNAQGVTIDKSSAELALDDADYMNRLTADDLWHILDCLVAPRPKRAVEDITIVPTETDSYLHYYSSNKTSRTVICAHQHTGFLLTVVRNTL